MAGICFILVSLTGFAAISADLGQISEGTVNLTNVAYTDESNTFDNGTVQTMDNLTVTGTFSGHIETVKWNGGSFSTTSGYLPLYFGMQCTASQCYQPVAVGETATGSILGFQIQQQTANALLCKGELQIRNGTTVLESIDVITNPFTGDEVTTEIYERGEVPFTVTTGNNFNIYYYEPTGRDCTVKSWYAGYVRIQYD